MTHPSKVKGNRFEGDVVKEAKKAGLEAIRSYGSDGRTRGLPAGVDVTIGDYKIQCKIRKKLAEYLYPEDGIDVQVIRQDYGEALAIMPLSEFIRLVALEKENRYE